MHTAIYEELKRVARAGEITFYGAIAPLAGLDMRNPADRNRIAHILGEISTYEHQQRRPMLSAVVVLQETTRPGPGFFTLARELGCYLGNDDEAFFIRELNRVYQEWRGVTS